MLDRVRRELVLFQHMSGLILPGLCFLGAHVGGCGDLGHTPISLL